MKAIKRLFSNLGKWFFYHMISSRQGYKRVVHVDDMVNFLWDYQQYLRGQWKWGEPPDDIETIYEKWYEILNDNNLHLDGLIQ